MMKNAFHFAYLFVAILWLTMVWGFVSSIMNNTRDAKHYSKLSDVDIKFYPNVSQGVISLPKGKYHLELSNWSNMFEMISTMVGVIAIIQSVSAIVATLMEHITFLRVVTVFVIVSVVFECVGLGMVHDTDSKLHDKMKDDMVSDLHEKYKLGPESNDYSRQLNAIMMEIHCCGIRSYKDILNFTYTDNHKKKWLFATSPACCKKQYWTQAENDFNVLLECVKYDADIYSQGCYMPVFNDSFSDTQDQCIILIILIIIWQIAIMTVSSVLVVKIKQAREIIRVNKAAKMARGGVSSTRSLPDSFPTSDDDSLTPPLDLVQGATDSSKMNYLEVSSDRNSRQDQITSLP